MIDKFKKLLNKVDWRDLRACMRCREVCECYDGNNVEECLTCPVNESANFKKLLEEIKEVK